MNPWFDRNSWWVRRIAALPVHLFLFAIVVFFIVRLVPGDPAVLLTQGKATAAQLVKVREALGLGGSLPHQLGTFLLHLVQLNFGSSLVSGRPVALDVFQRLPQTLELTGMGLVGAAIIALVLGSVAVFRPKNPIAYVARGYARAAGAVPDFCLGIVAILIFYVVLHLSPAPIGRIDPRMTAAPTVTGLPFLDTLLSGDSSLIQSAVAHLVLPVAAMSIAYAPYLLKQLIPGLEDQIDAPATRFRIASGGSTFIMIVSVYRRALPAVLVVLGGLLGALLGGAVVMESMFGLGGVGQYAVNAVQTTDYPAMQGVLVILVAFVLLVFLVVDVLNMLLDPRRRSGAIGGA
ncbi:ABC transporter permease [Frondihabitans cladoniiphilus]|uniref:ABC transporter permease n=1 Tax=Frondihabitans cladoniiphilus TaxID=715785 RepID=A0ABP8W705_9MICO